MSHNIALSENPTSPGEIGRLTIAAAAKAQPSGKVRTLRVSRVRGGLRFHADPGGAHVHGEDLYALREFIEELDEELFVRPADPVEVPRWADGDIIVETEAHAGQLQFRVIVWQRQNGTWTWTKGGNGNGSVRLRISDAHMSRMIDGAAQTILTAVVQASGVDL